MGETIKESLFRAAIGGDTAILLLMFGLSIAGLAIAIDRTFALIRARQQLARYLTLSEPDEAGNPFGRIAADVARTATTDVGERQALFDARYQPLRQDLTRRVSFLGTLGANGPFIGLLGTVLGVMQAFADLAKGAQQGPTVVMAGISEALIATAVGLAIAIPAVVTFNFFQRAFRKVEDDFRSALFARLLGGSSTS